MPKVSVIIPSYNHGKYIKETIQSVLDQTFQDFEIVITDDGSSDNTVEEIKKFDDKRIKLFVFSKNKGACAAANNCVNNSTGRYIAMLSSDDIFLPDKLEKQVDFLDSNPGIGVVFSRAQIIDEDGNNFKDPSHAYSSIFDKKNRSRYEWLNYFFYHGNCLCHPSALIRKKCYDKVGLYDERFASLPDLDFWVRVCMHFDIYIMPQKLIKFRVRHGEANASGNRPENHIRNRLEFKEILIKYLDIKTAEDFSNIFPDVKIPQKINRKLIPFYIAQASLQSQWGFVNLFGIEVLYNIMNDEEAVKLLHRLGFSFSDLIKITGQYDVFQLFDNNIFSNRIIIIATFINYLIHFEIRKAVSLFFRVIKKLLRK